MFQKITKAGSKLRMANIGPPANLKMAQGLAEAKVPKAPPSDALLLHLLAETGHLDVIQGPDGERFYDPDQVADIKRWAAEVRRPHSKPE